MEVRFPVMVSPVEVNLAHDYAGTHFALLSIGQVTARSYREEFERLAAQCLQVLQEWDYATGKAKPPEPTLAEMNEPEESPEPKYTAPWVNDLLDLLRNGESVMHEL